MKRKESFILGDACLTEIPGETFLTGGLFEFGAIWLDELAWGSMPV